MIGLKRGTVELCDHDVSWEENAKENMIKLRLIFGEIAIDIQHVGSTAILPIKAKPIIDIAVAVNNFDDITALIPKLELSGFIHRPQNHEPPEVYFSCGDELADTRTHHIHVVKAGSKEWQDYINFRDYLNAYPSVAKEYEHLKLHLMKEYKHDRLSYTNGKAEFIQKALRKAQVYSFLGKIITVTIDRPIGCVHPNHEDIIYPINYGYIEGVIAPDGEELDVYIHGVNEPVKEFTGKVIAIIHRNNDVEDKLVAVPKGFTASKEEIRRTVLFQKQFYDSEIEMISVNH